MKERNRSVDILRLTAAFFVICLHNFSGSGVVGSEEVVALARFAVPVFFLFSGYFGANFTLKRKLWQFGKILLLAVVSNLGYLGLLLLKQPTNHMRLVQYQMLYTPEAWHDFWFWNESPAASHLWFLGALTYILLLDLIFSPILAKLKWRKGLLWVVTGGLLVSGLVIYHVYTRDPQVDFHLCYYRSYLWFGMPFYLAGKLLRDSKFTSRPLPSVAYWVGIPVLACTTVLEYRLLGVWEVYISSILLALLLMHLTLNHPLKTCPKPVAVISWLGRHGSLTIYIVHVYILNWVRDLYYKNLPWQYELGLFHLIPLAVFLISAVIGVVPGLCSELIHRRKKA